MRGRYAQVTCTLFPNYLFARLKIGEDNVAPIRSTQGVIGLTRFGLQIPPVPEGFVEALLARTPTPAGFRSGRRNGNPGRNCG